MLNKNQSRKVNSIKYAFVLPLLILFVIQFQTKVVAQTKENKTFEPAKEEQYLVVQDTTVWVKDVAKSYEEETAIVSLKEETEHLNPKKKPLYIINGEEIPKEKTNGIWHLEGEVTETEYKEKEAVEKFGERGKDGVIVLEGKVKNLFFQTKEDETGSTSFEQRDKEAQERAKQAAIRAKDAEQRAKDAQKRAEDAKVREADAKIRAKDAEQRVKDAQKRADDAKVREADAKIRAKDAEQRAKDAQKRVDDAKIREADAKIRAKDAEQRAKDAKIRLE